MSFAQIDPAKILSYGVIGLGFLLALLAYFLLQREQRAVEPRRSILKAIKEFMIFAVVVGCLGLAGEIARSRFAPKPMDASAVSAPVPCSAMPEWPKGRWWAWGRLDTPPTKENTDDWKRLPQINPEVVFTSDLGYEAQTEQPTDDARRKVLTAVFISPLKPGGTVLINAHDGTGYISHGSLTATDDGCIINGNFTDSVGNAGHLHFLYQSPRYFISPK
jgi:hypothetical protein